ncbi:MAG: hypothetical protein ACP5VE_05900 [Chthonomonadales bacterium]
MQNDEPPAEVAAQSAALPEDTPPGGDGGTAPSRPATRRRSASQAPKRRTKAAQAAPPEPSHTPSEETSQSGAIADEGSRDTAPSAPAAEPGAPSRRRAARRTPKPHPPTAAEEAAEPEPGGLAPAAEEAPAQEPPSQTLPDGYGAPVAVGADTESRSIPTEEEASRPAKRVRRTTSAKAADGAGCRLVTRRGLIELHIAGLARAPIFFFGNTDGAKESRRVASQVRRAAQAGVHLFSTLVELPCPLPPDDTVYDELDARLAVFFEADPEAYMLPRLVFVPAPGWRRQYPDEVIHYADGTTGDPSLASDRFWLEAEHALRGIVEHLEHTPHRDRIIGFHLERGEWFHPVDTGFDLSFANREAFREWLRAKYKNSVVALRAAWFDGEVQFHTAEIPPLPKALTGLNILWAPRRERRMIDFLEYTSDITAQRIISLAKAAKEASANRALVSVCYGYTFEFDHTFSGHLALEKILDCPAIDIVAGPPSYRDRQIGGAASFPGPVDAAAIHGKLWVSEEDIKTHLAPQNGALDDFNPRLPASSATHHAQLRSMGKALAHQTGVLWMDLWGEGWLDAADIWDGIGAFHSRYSDLLKHRKAKSPEVAVLVSERSLMHVRRDASFLRRLLAQQRDLFQKLGASVGFYLQSDVVHRAFPTDARLYVFLNPYRITPEQRQAVKEKLQNGGKTLVWLYAIGVCEDRGQPEESANDLVGMALRPQSWGSPVGSLLVQPHHPITEGIRTRELGVQERITPSFFVDEEDPSITVLYEYAQTGLPSVAVRDLGTWKSVFCGEPTLSLDLLEGLCRYAGVHRYLQTNEDYVWAGHGWVTVHSPRNAVRSLWVPDGLGLYDVTNKMLVAEALKEYKMAVHAGCTRIFYVGTIEEMRRLSLPGIPRMRPRRARPLEVQDVVIEAGLRPEASAPADANPEAPAVPPEEAQPDTKKRRRRRRGGRGRSRKHQEVPQGAAPDAEPGPQPAA